MRPRVAAGDTLPDLSLTSRAGRNLAGTGVSPPPVDPAPQVPAPAWRGPGSGAGRLPALDGLRAVAVLAVLGYHAGLSWLPGGLLGVDAFFVLSGYLITSLLLAEWQRTGRIDLRRFWVRRARRLLPALLLVVLAVAVTGGWLVGATGTAGLRWDALAALGYVANWRFALSGQGYFDHFTVPSPLLHLWSLGVEEQFYLIWPLLALLALWVAQRRGRQGRPHGGGSSRSGAAGTVGVAGARAVLAAAAIGAAASTTLLAALAVAGADDSRLYYGTDTRAAALLVGACLAAAGAASWRPLGRARAGTTAAGLAGLAGAAVFAYAVLRVDGQDPVLYRGGFLVVALAVAAIVNAAAVPADVLTGRRGHHYVPPPGSLAGAGAHAPIGRIAGLAPRVLSLAPLAYLGRISYGLYLWHWPAYLLLTRTRTGLSGGSLLAARLAATLVVAVASYHLVESPIRERRVRVRRPRLVAGILIAAVVAAVPVAATAWRPSAGSAPSVSTPEAAAARAPFAAIPPEIRDRQWAALGARPRGPGQPPVVLLVGDSVALTLGMGLTPPLLDRYGVKLVNIARLGCGIAPGEQAPGSGGAPEAGSCHDWPAVYGDAARRIRPDVVTLLVGRWEVIDRRIGGQTVHVGDPRFDAAMTAEFEQARRVFGASGAKLVLMTAPCYDAREGADGSLPPEDDPARVARFNSLITSFAAAHAADVRVVDLFGAVCPGGRFTPTLSGVPVRTPDGVHFDMGNLGPALAPVLLPELRAAAH